MHHVCDVFPTICFREIFTPTTIEQILNPQEPSMAKHPLTAWIFRPRFFCWMISFTTHNLRSGFYVPHNPPTVEFPAAFQLETPETSNAVAFL